MAKVTKRKKKSAPARKPAAKKAAPKRTAAPAKKRAAKKVVAKKVAAKKPAAKKPAAKKIVAKRAPAKKPAAKAPAPKKAEAAKPRVAPRAALAAAPAAESSAGPSMERHVVRELGARDIEATPDVVAAVVAVGLGYRKGPASDPGFLTVTIDVDELVAQELVERLSKGVRPAEMDREMHRSTVRSTVNVNVAQLGVDANDTVRATLTSLALGSWRPGFDENARRNALASFLVAWYRAGLA